MVSAFQEYHRGLGFLMQKEELDLVNAHEIQQGKQLLAVSQGLIFFNYCKGREGYWGALCFNNQTEDVLDCLEVLHPGWQLATGAAGTMGWGREQQAQWDGV